jgi:hypothetical protein
VTCTATDAAGNTSTSTFTVTVTDDENPVLAGTPADSSQSNDAGLCTAVVNYTDPTATDNCPGTPTVSCSPASGSTFDLGPTTVTCTATDAAGNTSTSTFTVTVNDNENPGAITGMPIDIMQKNDAGSCDAVVTWTEMPSAEDNCDGTLAAVPDIASGSTFLVGDTTVTYTATDSAGNMSTATFVVTINDNEDPFVVLPVPVEVTGDGSSCTFAVTVPVPVANDNCDVDTLTNDFNGTGDASGDYPYTTTLVTWTVTDVNGNSAIQFQNVTVTPPLDCNSNGESDGCDISTGFSQDINLNGIPDECEEVFIRGDVNNNGIISITDAYWLLLHMFVQPSLALDCLDAADSDNSGAIDLADAIYLYSALIGLGPPPPAPFPGCGLDTADTLGCDNYNDANCP